MDTYLWLVAKAAQTTPVQTKNVLLRLCEDHLRCAAQSIPGTLPAEEALPADSRRDTASWLPCLALKWLTEGELKCRGTASSLFASVRGSNGGGGVRTRDVPRNTLTCAASMLCTSESWDWVGHLSKGWNVCLDIIPYQPPSWHVENNKAFALTGTDVPLRSLIRARFGS